tara:strand:+ start:386 stop:610 length:225 start_codon:yes stop_codon:yes gene_type:complete
VNYCTENAGSVMADGDARIPHRIGVVTAQNSPAATLLVSSLAEAASLLAHAGAPVVIAGGGVHLLDACAELAAL